MPSTDNQGLGPEEISEIIKMQKREEAGKPTQSTATRGVNLRTRTFASPVKPIFDGKSLADAMQRRNSDSTTLSQKMAELDPDELSLSSVQNMPTIPSVSESPGLFSMLANFSRFTTSTPKTTKAAHSSDKDNDDTAHRIGELPNKANLQQFAHAPVHMVDLQQNSGSLAIPEGENSISSRGLSGRLHRSSYATRISSGMKNATFQALNDGVDDDDFFAAMDANGTNAIPLTSEDTNRASSEEKARGRKKNRGSSKPTDPMALDPKSQALTPSLLLPSNNEVTSSTDMLSGTNQDNEDEDNNNDDGIGGFLSTPSPDWTPIVPVGTRIQRPRITTTIDESEHSLSSIAAKRRPLAKETVLAQEMARKQQEALAALMAQSAETLDLEEIDESVVSADPDERPTAATTSHDWHDVVEEAFTKKASRPLALSVDDDDDEEGSDENARRVKPKSREVQKIQGRVEQQEEQLRSIVQSTPDAYQALQDTEIMTKKETREVTKNRSDWHDVSEDTKKSQSKDAMRKRDFFEDPDASEEKRPRPPSRDARKLDEAARRQRRQVQTTIEATPDATRAMEPSKVLSEKDKYSTRKTNDQWYDVSADSAQARLNNAKESPIDDDDRNEKGRHKTRRMRSFEETAKKQKETVENLLLDTVQPEESLEKIRGESRLRQRDGSDWHNVDVDKQKSHEKAIEKTNESYPKRSIESQSASQDPNDSSTTDKKRTIDKSPSKSKSKSPSVPSKAKPQPKKQDYGPTSAYPVSDAPVERDDEVSNNTSHVVTVSTGLKIPKFEENQPISNPDETESLLRQSRQDWYGVDAEQYPLNSKGFYKHDAKDGSKETSVSAPVGNKSPAIDIAPSKRQTKSSESSSKTKSQSKTREISPTNAYPVSDATYKRDNDVSMSLPLVLTTTIKQSGKILPLSVADEEEPSGKSTRQDWHEVDAAQYPWQQKGFYKDGEQATCSTEQSAKDGKETKGRDETKGTSSVTTSIVKVSDATYEGDDDRSRSLPLVSTTALKQMGTNLSSRVADETEPLVKQTRQDWHEVDAAQHPWQQKGFYKDAEQGGGSAEKSAKARGESKGTSSATASRAKSREKSTRNKSVEDSVSKRKNASGTRTNSKSPKSRSKNSSNSPISDAGVTNVVWQRVSSHHPKDEEGKENKGKGTGVVRNRKGDHKETNAHAVSSQTNSEIVLDICVELGDPLVLNEVESVDGPFSKRPELNPFNHRPMVLQPTADLVRESIGRGHDEMTLPTQPEDSDDNKQLDDTKTESSSDSGRDSTGIKDNVVFDDNDTTLSKQEARRRLLRQKVDDRREALTSIFHHTQEVSLSAENEILDLKRKLALSQALVQRLEIENGELERRALLEFSDAQLKLLKQRDNREKELEDRIKTLMKERDAAVLECHDLRILLSGSCDICRQRFNHQRDYFMDYSVRKTITSKRVGPEASAFQWFTAGLSQEMQNALLESETEMNETQNLDFDSSSLQEGPVAQSSAVFQFVPFQWLSTKLVVNAAKGKKEDHPTPSETTKEKTFQGVEQVMSTHDSTSHETIGDSNLNNVKGMEASNSLPGGNISGEANEGPNENKDEDGIASRELANQDAHTPNTASMSIPTDFADDPTTRPQIGGTDEDKLINQSSKPFHLAPNEEKKSAIARVTKGKSFFSSLFGEKVDEEGEFASGNFLGFSNTLKRFDSSSQKPRKLGVGLKDERVLDDMEILNSIMSISTPGTTKGGEKPRFGLGDERFNDDERDRRILGALSQRGGTLSTLSATTENTNNGIAALRSEKFNEDNRDAKLLNLLKDSEVGEPLLKQASLPATTETKKSGITAMRSKKFNDDYRDAKLLSLLKESEIGDSLLKQSPSTARAPQRSHRQPNMSEMSTLSYPELSPRKRLSTNKGRRGASISGTYLGQFSNRTFNVQNKDTSRSPIPLPMSPLQNSALNDPKSGSPLIRDSRLLAFQRVPVDVELEDERPWRSDTGLPHSNKTFVDNDDHSESNVDSSHERPLTDSHATGSMTGPEEDLDQILALLAHEDA